MGTAETLFLAFCGLTPFEKEFLKEFQPGKDPGKTAKEERLADVFFRVGLTGGQVRSFPL